MKGKSGFTLIELLVVIAIIAILAAILFPVFAQARATARKTVCLSNLKQLNLGVQQYIQDYDERFPGWTWGNRYTADSGTFWDNAIYPYVKNLGVYQCPDDILEWNHDPDWTRNGPDGGANDRFVTPSGCNFWDRCNPTHNSYAINETLTGARKLAAVQQPASYSCLLEGAISLVDAWQDPALAGRIAARAAFASQTEGCCMMWGEIGGNYGWHTAQEYIDFYGKAKCDNSARHQGGTNVSYVDSHVKFQRWMDLTPDKLSPI
ncbi:MAG: DUF1559 domain-containing protein [Chthonomonadales bacterium]|nr:DUF1559 domain-containing protein [Chthonomonadales bacterium]